MFYLALIGVVFIGVCTGFVAGVMIINVAAGIYFSYRKPHFAAADQSSSPH